jgi:gliding motility-associated-like protein
MWSNGIINEFNNYITAGHYEVTAIDSWGCTGTHAHDVADANEILLTAGVTGAGCFGGGTGSIIVQATGGIAPYNYQWNNGLTGNSINNLMTGNYTVTVTDGNNCSKIGTYFVGNPSNPLHISIANNDASCYGKNDGSIIIAVSGGTPEYSYHWEFNGNSFNGSRASNLSIGTYNLTISDSQGCGLDTTVVIGQPSAMDYSFFSINPSCAGNNDGYIEISVTGGSPPYNYSWSDQTSSIEYIAGIIEGNYLFTITDNNNCTIVTESINIQDDAVDCITIPNAFTPNSDGVNDTWLIDNIELFPWALIQVFNRWGQLVFEGKGGGEPWDGTWNNNIVPTGSYVYTVDLFNGTKYCGIVTVVQ